MRRVKLNIWHFIRKDLHDPTSYCKHASHVIFHGIFTAEFGIGYTFSELGVCLEFNDSRWMEGTSCIMWAEDMTELVIQ